MVGEGKHPELFHISQLRAKVRFGFLTFHSRSLRGAVGWGGGEDEDALPTSGATSLHLGNLALGLLKDSAQRTKQVGPPLKSHLPAFMCMSCCGRRDPHPMSSRFKA